MSRTLSAFSYPRFGRAVALAAVSAGVALAAAGPAAAHHVSGRPHMPQHLRVVTTTSTTVTIAWSRTARKFHLSKNGNRVATTTRIRHTFRNLDCGRGYRFGVRAVGKHGSSAVAARWVHTSTCATDPVAPVNVERPDVSGNAREGDLLVTTDGEWTGWGPFTYTHRWLRCNSQGQECNPIDGAFGTAYLVSAADVGKKIRSQVEAANGFGSTISTSYAVGPAVGPGGTPPPPPDPDPEPDPDPDPDPDPPPPPPPPPPPGTEPTPRTVITVTNARWDCSKPLTDYGPLPILVEQTWNNNMAASSVGDGVWIEPGCIGDGNPVTIDLILHVNGNGTTVGPSDDGITVKQGARDLDITGYVNCGRLQNGAHQDGVQINGGTRVRFYDFRSGDAVNRKYTCWGAGGGFYPSATNGNPTDVVCIRCVMVNANQGLRVDASLRSGARDSVFIASLPLRVNMNGDAVDPVDHNNQGIVIPRPPRP
jgi:hypothetical protein